jgi:hypothetical protein
VIGINHRSPGTTLRFLFNKRRRVHTTGYRGTQNPTQTTSPPPRKQPNKQTIYMPRRASAHSSDEDNSLEVGTPHLPILTRAQRRRFIEEQQKILQKLIRTYSSDRTVFYTLFDTLGVLDDELEELLGVQKVIYEIIFDQTSRTTFVFYSRDIPHGTFTRVRGERSDIPEGPPNYDSDGNEIISEEDFFSWDEVEINTDEESE